MPQDLDPKQMAIGMFDHAVMMARASDASDRSLFAESLPPEILMAARNTAKEVVAQYLSYNMKLLGYYVASGKISSTRQESASLGIQKDITACALFINDAFGVLEKPEAEKETGNHGKAIESFSKQIGEITSREKWQDMVSWLEGRIVDNARANPRLQDTTTRMAVQILVRLSKAHPDLSAP